ncbi:MAG: DUF2797 domain-containing protein [Candidatus Micrarchaeia archaeon]
MKSRALAEYMKHTLQFSSSEDVPILLYRENSQIGKIDLKGELGLSFSEDLFCIGYKKDGEEWRKCTHGATHTKQCAACQFRDIARIYTVGDFTLYPHMKEQLDSEKYVIYLAQFGADITKIGLTRRSRFEKRWREQGADFASAILEFDGPDEAYPAEQFLQSTFDFANSVRATQKLRRLSFDKSAAKAKIESAVAKIAEHPSIQPYWIGGEITDMSKYYPQIKNPEIVDFVGGEILGAKGSLLFFKGASGLDYATNMGAHIGRFAIEKKQEGQMGLF